MATTLKINAKRLNIADPLPASLIMRPQVGHFQAEKSERPFPPIALLNARWNVCAYSIRRTSAAAYWQPGAILRMPFSERLCRHGGIVCGQALMALADTAMVIAILAANRGYRPMTTVDQTTHFMRAVTSSDVLADARVVRLGRTMSFGRVTLLGATDNKPVAMVSSAFAML